MPVNRGKTQLDRFNWTCPCGKSMGSWPTEEEAAKDLKRHRGVCNLNANRGD